MAILGEQTSSCQSQPYISLKSESNSVLWALPDVLFLDIIGSSDRKQGVGIFKLLRNVFINRDFGLLFMGRLVS